MCSSRKSPPFFLRGDDQFLGDHRRHLFVLLCSALGGKNRQSFRRRTFHVIRSVASAVLVAAKGTFTYDCGRQLLQLGGLQSALTTGPTDYLPQTGAPAEAMCLKLELMFKTLCFGGCMFLSCLSPELFVSKQSSGAGDLWPPVTFACYH